MKSVRDIIQNKGRQIWAVSPDDTVFNALKLMADKNIGAVMVLKGEEVAGILSERDYARKVILLGKSSKNIPVREIMTPQVYFVEMQQTADECLATMLKQKIRHLPVLEDRQLGGIISIGDVVKAVLEDKDVAIEELQNYIIGRR